MSRETKISLVVIAGLLASFGYVLYSKWGEREARALAARAAADAQTSPAAGTLDPPPAESLHVAQSEPDESPLGLAQSEPEPTAEADSGIAEFAPRIRPAAYLNEHAPAREPDLQLGNSPAGNHERAPRRTPPEGAEAVDPFGGAQHEPDVFEESPAAPRRFPLALDREAEAVADSSRRRAAPDFGSEDRQPPVSERSPRGLRAPNLLSESAGAVAMGTEAAAEPAPVMDTPAGDTTAEPSSQHEAPQQPEVEPASGRTTIVVESDPFVTQVTRGDETQVTPVAGEAEATPGDTATGTTSASPRPADDGFDRLFDEPAAGEGRPRLENPDSERAGPERSRERRPPTFTIETPVRRAAPTGFPETADEFAEPVPVVPGARRPGAESGSSRGSIRTDSTPRPGLNEPIDDFSPPASSTPRGLDGFQLEEPSPARLQPEPDPFGSQFGGSPEPATPVGANQSYTVVAGDNYWNIAKRFYGAGGYSTALQEFNKERIPDPTKMRPGMIVVIPPVEVLRAKHASALPGHLRGGSSGPSAAGEAAQASGFFLSETGQPLYRVAKGDVLSDIAHHHLGRSSRWIQIYELNRDQLSNPNDLKVGTVLRLPPDASRVQMVRESAEYR